MIWFRRHSIIFRVFALILAFQIFNVCVDVPDPQPQSIAEDLSVNDPESFIELFLEVICKIDNAISEHDDQDANRDSDYQIVLDSKLFSESNDPIYNFDFYSDEVSHKTNYGSKNLSRAPAK